MRNIEGLAELRFAYDKAKQEKLVSEMSAALDE